MNVLLNLAIAFGVPLALLFAAIGGAVFLRWLYEIADLHRRNVRAREARRREFRASVALGEFDDLIDLDAVRAARRGRRVA